MKSRANQTRRLDPIWHELGEEEREVLLLLAARLQLGQQRIGRLDLARDSRDWAKERREEALDLLVYDAIEAVASGVRTKVDLLGDDK